MAASEPPKPRLSVINTGWSSPPNTPPDDIDGGNDATDLQALEQDSFEAGLSESEALTALDESAQPQRPDASAATPPASEEPTKMWRPRSKAQAAKEAVAAAAPAFPGAGNLPLPKPPPPPRAKQPARTILGVAPPPTAFNVEPPTTPSLASLQLPEAPAPEDEVGPSDFVLDADDLIPTPIAPEERPAASFRMGEPASFVAPLALPPVKLSDALLQRVQAGPVAAPLWAVLAVFGAVLGVVVGLVTLLVGVASASADDFAMRVAPVSSLSSKSSEVTPPKQPNTQEQGASQKPTIKAGQPNTAQQVAFLAREREVQDRLAAQSLREKLADNPALYKDKQVAEQLWKFTKNETTAVDALFALAQLPGSTGADLLYEVWTGTVGRSPATELAEALLYTEDVSSKASPALRVALEIRRAEACEQLAPLVKQALERGDRRSMHLLGKLTKRTGCGVNKRQDCYKCLRDGDLLKDAIAAVRKRPAPKL